MATRVRSYSKINLGLAVGPARADGFHALTTVYQTLALHDYVTVSARLAEQTVLTLKANHPAVPTDLRNTAWKMVAGALARLGICAKVEIEIDKRLPVQGGMGAGSANAVAALIGLERELGQSGVAELAEVGSDVPLFLLGGTVLGLGRGEEVYPLAEADAGEGIPCVVATPMVGVSTGLAFAELDKRQRTLTSGQAVDKIKQLSYAIATVWGSLNQTAVEAGPSGITRAVEVEELRKLGVASAQRGDLAENPLLALVRTGIENDFEEVAFSQHPSLRSIKRDLLGTSAGISVERRALYACLSGSGSALFGLYKTQAAASEAQQRVQKNGTRAILTETLARPAYWSQMFQ
jgi:4-diphosphocytidyl-2-C-methyl-D-erythritol kinase